MTDALYKELGVKKTATEAQIKAAYRKKARVTHPDVNGGVRGPFERIQIAHDVLTDPERRAFYDSTGKIKADDPDAGRGPEISMIAAALQTMAAAAAQKKIDLRYEDVLSACEGAFQANIKAIRQKIADIRERMDYCDLIRGRLFAEDGEENVLSAVMLASIGSLQEETRLAELNIEVLNKALALLKKHRYRTDFRSAMTVNLGMQTFFNNATT